MSNMYGLLLPLHKLTKLVATFGSDCRWRRIVSMQETNTVILVAAHKLLHCKMSKQLAAQWHAPGPAYKQVPMVHSCFSHRNDPIPLDLKPSKMSQSQNFFRRPRRPLQFSDNESLWILLTFRISLRPLSLRIPETWRCKSGL